MDRQYDFAALEALLKKRSFKALREALLELNEVDSSIQRACEAVGYRII